MRIKNISIKNFKSLYDVSFDPGRVNVFIGANGAGKSSILEAIGILSAAMTDRVNNNALVRKGIRLSASALYKSKFKSMEREGLTVDFGMSWMDNEHDYDYMVHLTTPTDNDVWKYHSENVSKDQGKIWGRSNRTVKEINNKIGYYLLSEELNAPEYHKMADYIEKYGVYQPDTLTLRGTVADQTQVTPIGLNGGRLADAMQSLLEDNGEYSLFGNLFMDDVLELMDWASDFKIASPKKSNMNPGVPSTRQIIEFKDRYLKDKATFTGYDASEGALYILFMLCLAMHPETPDMFAIDSFDHALNPRLAKRITEIFSQIVIEKEKTVFMTTHNPLVLDGLAIGNDDVRLFTVSRNKNGFVEIKRIQVSEELLREGQPLSRLWINGRLGGVPELL